MSKSSYFGDHPGYTELHCMEHGLNLIPPGAKIECYECAIERRAKEEATVNKEKHILGVIEDLVSNFLYYDRKEDEDLPRGSIERAVKNGVITIEDMTRQFKKCLEEGLSGD
jgi:hypothetical protein